eukprot:CAMPEP_0116914368 /NCGR_PEP_ID=MMETSP0467-20121206/17291_1 /TAXON_ID=283647 /ORGANISM="Mesodinium pulex, Strain SPMC105" /LENGTH=115 /DNA_ID=CAMNT_0004590827 /DNA_START=321 /DNA_END=668 /DNA_ORIENTATION=+
MELARQVMRGIKSKTDEVNCKISGGQTVMNPWFLVGGTAITTVPNASIVQACENPFQIGDSVILTKPLGVNLAGRLRDLLESGDISVGETQKEELLAEIEVVEQNAVDQMAALNV